MGILNGAEMTLSYILHSVFRLIQIIMALTVCGLYGVDLHKANKEHKYSDGKWVCLSSPPPSSTCPHASLLCHLLKPKQVYAEVTASLSAVLALLYLIPFTSRIPFAWVCDTILFILWIALFGLFGNMYIKERAEGDAGVQRMKNAVWVDLVNALLWLISAVGMLLFWVRHRNNRSRWTGRAQV